MNKGEPITEIEARLGAGESLVEVIKLEVKKIELYRRLCLALAQQKGINTVAALMEFPAGIRGMLPRFMREMFIDWYNAGGWEKLGMSEKKELRNNKHIVGKFVEGGY